MPRDIYASTPQDHLSLAELELYHAIMAYRAQNGLAPLPLSKALTTTAGRHVVDTRENIWGGDGLEPGANLHSWSDAPYYPDHSNPEAMWEAPERLGTGYDAPGYEISAAGYGDGDEALQGWKGSPGHDAVLTESGGWAAREFRAIGVGLDTSPGPGPYGGRVYHVWFGHEADPTGPPRILGTGGGDRVVGTAFADRIFGADGDDLIEGDGGADELRGQDGDDRILGGRGADRIFGGRDADELRGGRGGDRLEGNAGSDTLLGWRGHDRLVGGAHRDVLEGGPGRDKLLGGRGADTLAGGPHRDVLIGGPGRDSLDGGAGADVFRFRSAAEAGRGGGRDRIEDFRPGLDTLHLARIDADPGSGRDDAFDFLGALPFSLTAGELRYAAGLVEGDRDGDGDADLEIRLAGRPDLGAGDIVL